MDPEHRPEGSEEEKRKFVEKFERYATTNKEDMVSYVVLIIGIVFLFFWGWLGGILIGIVFGVYFAREIIDFFKGIHGFIEKEGIVRSLILLATAVAFFILNPAFFIAAAVGVGIKEILLSFKKK